MSRSSAQRQQQKQHAQELLGQSQNDAAAAAAEYFDMFCQTTTMRQVLGLHRNMCDALGLRPSPLNEFYPKLKEKIKSWKAQALFKKFDARAAHRVYGKGNACTGTRVLVIGAGPCGLRTAIEAQLLGAKVVVVEKRDRISRNNVLHLWPFVITDLRNLGAKKFYGKFCAGSIDHISIRQLQCILLKVALLLGVEVHEGVSFENTIEPSDGCGWRAEISPPDHVVSHYEFDVLIGADGKRNTLEGFKRKEFRGKLAIAITANFVNRKTEAEAKAEEISGVAFIFNQSFFKELYHTTGIDLENIVYYKDETHYFVMTAKKHSLIDKGVIMQDCADPAELLSPNNVNREKLLDYAREAAEFSTKYQMPNLDFAVNHYGKPDVAMFDFTSMFAAETSCRVTVRKGYRLLQCLVGDSLLEPFWPTGSGCARGFLSSMDAAYTIKLWANPRNCSLGVLAQRESIYRLLGQTTPENLQRDIGAYTMDPATRYPNLNRTSVNIWQVKHLIDTDDPSILEQTFMDSNALQDKTVDTPVRRKRRSGDTMPLSTVLLRWICAQLHSYEFTQELKEVSDIFTNGKVLCALINRYRPDLVDFNSVTSLSPIECNELAFKILEREMNIPRIMSGKDSMQLNNIDSKVWLNYLEQICEVFRGEIPHVKHPKMDVTELREKYRINHRHIQPDFSKLLQLSSKQKTTSGMQDIVDVPQNVQRRSVLDEEKVKRHRKPEAAQAAMTASGSTQGVQADTPRRAKKRRNVEKSQNLEERQKRLEEIEHNRLDRQSRRRQQRYQQTQNFYKSLHMLHANTLLRESDSNEPFEDYSIFLYRQQAPEFNDRVKDLERKLLFPDRERSDIPSALPRGATDEQFNDRIKSMEQRMVSRTAYGTDKKPKDLMRAIGKIDSSDWNVREIEKKIEQAKKTEIHGPMGREKVPKWSKEQFMARQNKMAKPSRQDSSEEKFKEIDRTIKNLDKQLKEGNVLEVGERGRNKVASIAGQFVRKEDNQVSDDKNVSGNNVAQKSSSKVALAFKKQAASEKCHFCKQTVYLMEKTIAEDLTFHRACLKCHHCHTSLRMGGYAFDRDDPNGRFYCTQHFRLPAKAVRPVVRRSGQRKPTQQQLDALAASAKLDDADAGEEVGEAKTPEKLRGHADSVAQLDLLDRGQTPERIEFENTDAMSDGEPSEEHIIDEHEWSGRNFLPESNNDSESDLSSSDESDSETDSDIFEEVNDSPLGAQTLQLATDWIGKQNYTDSDDSDDFYDSSEGIADDGKDDTEGEEFKKARELRREEVRLLPLPPNIPTDTETEVQSESESTSPDEVELNSATEISTDSEFDHDEIIRQAPKIFIDDTHLRKPTKVQMKSVAKYAPTAKETIKGTSYLQKYQTPTPQPVFKPLVQVDPSLLISNRDPLQNPRPGDYLLNKTASTEGIASKKSLELKKRYLLGEVANGNKIQKSGSTSVLDSRIRSFQSNISECQKLLNPNSDVSTSMKTILDRTKITTGAQNELMRSATNNILNDLKVEITIQKASSTASTDNEKENVYVNSKNELNKGLEYSETVNNTLMETIEKQSPSTPTNNQTVIESIDLVTPEKQKYDTIDLTAIEEDKHELNSWTPDSNKIIDLTCDSPVDTTIIGDCKPDVSKDAKQSIPDLLGHIELDVRASITEEDQRLLSHSGDEEKCDSPEKNGKNFENDSVQIAVPNFPWNKGKDTETASSTTVSSCTSSSSSIEDIQHYMLESTTSPETQVSGTAVLNGNHQVPRVEIHDSSGTLMQVDSLMIIDGKYIGDPEDLKYMQLPEGVAIATVPQVPEVPAVKTSELEEDEVEPVTATPEPAECTVIETPVIEEKQIAPPLPEQGPPLPERGPPKMKPVNLKFDTKNENKIESLKALPLIVEQTKEHVKAVKPVTLNLSNTTSNKSQKSTDGRDSNASTPRTPTSPLIDNDKTPIADKSEDSEGTEPTQTGQLLTETELSDWTADDCISENFADMEFMLNSNKNTIKRNKKDKKKNGIKLPSNSEFKGKTAPVAEFEGILKSMDLDDIEFMDTGSEGSCAETYSATNTALLQNRGYVEFIETPKHTASYTVNSMPKTYNKYTPSVSTKRDEKLGIDYIEQGAYIMDNLKTPVNETPQTLPTTTDSLMSQSLTDSSTINDIDEDSLGVVTPNTRTANTNNCTTTEESDALTVVTSPLESTAPKQMSTLKQSDCKDVSTLSNSDKQARSSQSTSVCSSKSTPPKSKFTDELSYEDYVRALQQKITQISSARGDTMGKQRRKSSKGDEIQGSNTNVSTVLPSLTAAKVPEIPTLTRKLEEISKERNKQKDLIHDLVMDKLQSKKQLNAEKRLHRSRQRNLVTSGYSSGTSLSPTPKLAAASSATANSCSSKAHYHASTAALQEVEKEAKKENIPLQKSATYVSAYGMASVLPQTRTPISANYKQRPFSEHINTEQLDAFERFKLSKTPSFSYALTLTQRPKDKEVENSVMRTPRIENAITASTESLRSEARARARLKSNSELGLSPEEKMQLLRKRLYLEHGKDMRPVSSASVSAQTSPTKTVNERKISNSKSVSDLCVKQQQQLQQKEMAAMKGDKENQSDFISDPNLLSTVEAKHTKSGRRVKDPERRKSLIQSLSSFFHKSSKDAGASHAAQSEFTENSNCSTSTNNNNNNSASSAEGGMFSRFRISPKHKEKSKSCFDLRNFGFGDKDMILKSNTTTTKITSNAASSASETQLQEQNYTNPNKHDPKKKKQSTNTGFSFSTPQLYVNGTPDNQIPPPIPPLPLNYQRSDDESYANETREQKKQRAISKAVRQAELKRLRIAQEIQREQEEIEVQLKELEARGVLIEKALRGEPQNTDNFEITNGAMGALNDEKLLKELLEIWRKITQLKKRDEELNIRQQELQLEHRHAQLKEELNLRLSCNKLDKSSADVAAEGAILNEMLEIVAKRASLRPSTSNLDLANTTNTASTSAAAAGQGMDCIQLATRERVQDNEESII